MRHNFKYFFREGVKNMFSHGFMSFAAIGITVACLLIMGTFTLVAYNANENLKDLQRENAVLAFVDENLSEEEIVGVNIPTAVPLVYEFAPDFTVVHKEYLGDPAVIAAKMQSVANQGTAGK